jgi:glycosyltransferase involved in cell wall biosynthesis
MKIDLLGPVYPYRGGIAHYNASLARALSTAGHHVRLISFRRQYPTRLYPGESDRDPSVEPLRFPAEYILDPLYPWTWLSTARSILHEQPDLLIFHWWTTFWAPAYTSLAWLIRKKVKTVYLIHNVIPHEARVWDRWLARSALRLGDIYIVQAPHERERLLKLLPGRVQVIESPHPAYPPFGDQPLAKEDARQRLGLPISQPIFLFFGIVRPYKGLTHLLDALPRVQQPMHLVVAGEFWDDITRYQEQIDNLGIQEKVTIYNHYIPNEEAHLLFSAVDGLIAPYIGGTQSGAAGLAIGYGMPMIISERVAAGLPTGYPASRSAETAAQHNGYAHIVPPSDTVALAHAIDSLITQLPSIKIHLTPTSDDWGRLVKIVEDIGARRV